MGSTTDHLKKNYGQLMASNRQSKAQSLWLYTEKPISCSRVIKQGPGISIPEQLNSKNSKMPKKDVSLMLGWEKLGP
jgi:hypothetical protein